MFFLRKAMVSTEPLALTMSGVRMGERLLEIGADDAPLLAALALKVGMSGSAVVAVDNPQAAALATDAAARAGALIELRVGPYETLAAEAGVFDVVVVHSTRGLLHTLQTSGRADAVLRAARLVLRHGGRIVVIEAGHQDSLGGFLRPRRPTAEHEAAFGTAATLETAGFSPVRLLSERDGYRFIEGLKTNG
ncbi:MAG: methyltransferase domain-containing protein [Acidobacteria bacterium]|nr:methyltransferase domain-containing protein [Acidobacteriota bacterium]